MESVPDPCVLFQESGLSHYRLLADRGQNHRRVCETYVVHHLVSTGLLCAPSTCVRQMWGLPLTSGANDRLVVHNIALYRLGGAQEKCCQSQ